MSRRPGFTLWLPTYIHGFKIPVNLLGDLVREFAAGDLAPVPCPVEGRNLWFPLVYEGVDPKIVQTWAEVFDGYPGNLKRRQF